MSQVYHSNAKTNSHIREIIQKSNLSNLELAKKLSVNKKTISKWRNRSFITDRSSKPHNIKYSLSVLDKELIRVIKTLTWWQLEEKQSF